MFFEKLPTSTAKNVTRAQAAAYAAEAATAHAAGAAAAHAAAEAATAHAAVEAAAGAATAHAAAEAAVEAAAMFFPISFIHKHTIGIPMNTRL